MAWTPPSDAVEARTKTTTTGGWNPPGDALEVRPKKASQESLGMPMGEDMGSAIMAAAAEPKPERKVYTGSVFDTQPFDPKFNPEEAARLSRRDYAEKEAQQPRRTQYARATPADQIERSFGRAVADTGIGLLQGAAGIPKGIAANINAGDNPVAEFYEKAIQAGERSKSPYLQSQKAEREALLKTVLSNQGELAQTRAAFTSMFSPAGADVVAQGAGSMLPVVGMSLLNLGQKSFIATNALANAGEAAQNTARELSQMSPQDWSKSDTYQELRSSGLSHADSVRMLAPLMAMPTQLLGGIVGGVSGATGLEKSLAGKGIKGGARERTARAVAEFAGEELETLAPSFAGNVTQRLIDEKKSLTEGLGREAVETAFGATPGMALAAAGRSTPDAPKEFNTRGLADRMARERGFLVPETRAEPPAPPVRPSPAPDRVEPTFDEETFVSAPAAPKVADDLTLQREQEQADVLKLEAATSKPERFAYIDEAPKYDTPEMRLKQADALGGEDVTGLIFGETESYGRAALKKKSLTAGYAEKMDNRNDASDAATVAFGTGNYGVFTPYEKLYPKTAAKLKLALMPAPAPKLEPTTPPQVATEETAQQKLRRLVGRSARMTDARREGIITNQEYEKFNADLEAARQAAKQEAPDLTGLSPTKLEILEIADKLEAAGQAGFARAMRANARPESREMDEKGMEFYRSKLEPFEEKQTAPEKVSYGLPEFFSDNEKEVARITGLMKSGPLKTRIALSEANDKIQLLAETIQAAGFDINKNLLKGWTPEGILKIKSQIGVIAAGANRLATAAEAVQKNYKRADPARVNSDIANLMVDLENADNLIAEEPRTPSAAERMEGVTVPASPEVEEMMAKQRLAARDIETLSKRSSGTSLMKVLEGSLRDGEMSELAGKARQIGKNPFISLVAKKGKRGSSMEDMVDSGKLDMFLPFAMRPGQSNYDNGEAAEYIREQLRNGEFYTDDIRNEIDKIQRGIWEIEKEIEQELTLEDINREIQYAVDEQRALDQENAPTPAEGETETPESGAREEDLLKTQTKEELKAKQDEIDRLSKENERLSKEAERKAKADEEAGDFVLTGSKRDVDEAEARGQKPMFAAEANRGYDISAEDQRIEKELTGKSMIQAADWAVANAPNAFAKVIAEKVRNRLREFQRKGMTLEFNISGGSTRPRRLSGARGVTRFEWGKEGSKITVTLNGAAVMNNQGGFPPGVQYNTVLHELLHVATRSQFVFMPSTNPLKKQMTELFNLVANRFNADAKAGTLPPVMERYYKRMNNVLEDPDELLAWGLTDKEVQAYFDDIKVGDKSVFTRLVELIRTALGLGKPYESALERLVRTSESMLDVDVDAIDAMMGAKDKQIGTKKKPSGPMVQESLFQREGAPPKAPPTDTPAFKKWFGDSKVVDENGEPRIMYHGTSRDFSVFDRLKSTERRRVSMDTVGSWFSSEPFKAEQYAGGEGQNIMPVYLSIKNPKLYRSFDEFLRDMHEAEGRKLEEQNPRGIGSAGGLRAKLKAEGYDGIQFEQTDNESLYRDIKQVQESIAQARKEEFGVNRAERAPYTMKRERLEGTLRSMKAELEKMGGSTEFDGQDVYVAFEPTQIKSATGNIGTYDPENADISKSLEEDLVTLVNQMADEMVQDEKKRSPSLVRTLKTYNRQRRAGKMSEEMYIMMSDAAIRADQERKSKEEPKDRERGYLHIQERLSAAVRRGDLSREAYDLANWFMLQNEGLVADLGVSIKGKGPEGAGGFYNSLSRVITLIKDGGSDLTATHEILHHLERMMPTKVRQAIRKAWLDQLIKAAKTTKDPVQKLYFEAVLDANLGDNRHTMLNPIEGAGKAYADARMALEDMAYGNTSAKLAEMLLIQGAVPLDMYQYFNPSEFWAVNGSRIAQGRYDAVKGGTLIKLKNWLREFGQKIKSLLGLKSDASVIRALDSLIKGDGKFQTNEMLSKADNYAAITGKNVGGRKPLVNWTMPDSTNMDSFIYSIQNKQIDMKRAVDAITDQIGQIDERFDPYMKETLFAGRTATQTKRFLQNELEPLFKEMGRLDVNIPDFEEYLHNRHAQERNEQIAAVNPGMPDKGSGIETADAQAYFANLPVDQEVKYKKLAGMVDAITSGTRQLLVDSGLESQDTIDTWESTYDNYIPLNRDDIDYSSNHGMGVGQGYSVRGPASRRAVGSERKVVDILANIAMQRERNIVRAEKNRVAMAMYGLFIQNPNPDIALAVNPDAKKDIPAATQELVNMGFLPSDIESLMNEPSTMEIDPRTGLAVERVHQMQRGADNVMGLRVNGENRYVFFNQNNERAKRMATAIKNLDADKLGFILSTTADITRFMAAMNTQYNPIFGSYNFLRDISTAGLQLTNTPLAGKQKEVLRPSNVWGAMSGIYTDLRAERGGKAGTGQWSKLWEEFQQRGGQTGFRDQFSSTAKRGEALQRIVDPSSWADQGLGRVFTANGTLKVPMEAARKAAAPIFNWLSDYNETMENAIRLSAYKTALDNGMSKDAAAVLAKELTVNFNRKGQIATQAGALYAFFNASVQGTTALARTLSGPAGKKIIAGGLMLGAIQAVLYSVAGFDEGEPPEFIREKSFVIPTINGKYIAIPLPLGYNVIPNTARLITQDVIRFVQGKKVKPVDTAFKVFESLLGAFNPIGNAGWSFQTFAPTLADPFVAIGENKDYTGKNIARKDFNALDPTPGFTRYKESSTAFSRGLAEFMNSMSGGTKDAPGRISPTPDQIDYFIGQIFGGVGREAMKIERTVRSQITGEELPLYSIPFAGRFVGDTKGSSAVSNAFYENLKEMNIHENTVKGMRKRKENVQEYYRENPEARMFEEAGRVEREVQVLRKRRRTLVEKEAPKESVKAIEERITAKMKLFNDKVKKREEKKN